MSGDRRANVAGVIIVGTKIIKTDGTLMDARGGRIGESLASRLDPTAPGFDLRDGRPAVGQNTGSEWDHSDNTQNLNN
jgi:hypothetical protein